VKEDPSEPDPISSTMAKWQAAKSTKMDVCTSITQYYLSRDDAPDMEFKDGQVVFPFLLPPAEGVAISQTRSMGIYAEFPSMTGLLINVYSHLLFIAL
jgi:hypothetical protein